MIELIPSHPPLLAIPDRPVEIPLPPRLLITDRHQTQRIRGMARPIMLRTQSDIANVVLALVIEADRVPARLGGCLVPPDLRTEPPQGLDAHHRRTAPLVFHRRLDGEA